MTFRGFQPPTSLFSRLSSSPRSFFPLSEPSQRFCFRSAPSSSFSHPSSLFSPTTSLLPPRRACVRGNYSFLCSTSFSLREDGEKTVPFFFFSPPFHFFFSSICFVPGVFKPTTISQYHLTKRFLQSKWKL